MMALVLMAACRSATSFGRKEGAAALLEEEEASPTGSNVIISPSLTRRYPSRWMTEAKPCCGHGDRLVGDTNPTDGRHMELLPKHTVASYKTGGPGKTAGPKKILYFLLSCVSVLIGLGVSSVLIRIAKSH